MTKIDIISGFLGAGKTTFIKKMLEEVFSGEKVVLVENEYGEVSMTSFRLRLKSPTREQQIQPEFNSLISIPAFRLKIICQRVEIYK